MTNTEIKEVIEILKKEGCNSKKQAIEYLEGKLKEAIEKVNKYDELMTPKEVIVDDSEYEKYGESDYKCPSCNLWLRPDILMEKHCCNCGQALKWKY